MSQKSCYHCGDDVIGKGINIDDKNFCCNGCKSVYQLLSSNNLGGFYNLESQAGTRPKKGNNHQFSFLDVEDIRKKFIDFEDDTSSHTTLFLPQIHCSSCIYLLENIHRIEPRIKSCQVNFVKREAKMIFDKEMPLSELATILSKIGYTPNFGNKKEQKKQQSKTYLYKLGVAGFAFGSIMLWTFPEYFGIEKTNPEIRQFSAYLAFIVSIPVLLYSANEYLISAFKAIKYRSINLDVPISIGIIALYAESVYQIFWFGSTGYIDSFAGFVFFLLIGKWFQSKTYQSLSFERDYTSYFPVAVTKLDGSKEIIVEIDKVKIGDKIIIRNQEVLPCDAVLTSKEIKIDYSFVTGESIPVTKKKGEFIYAGGKLLGKKSEFVVEKESSRSHLTQLWNEVNKNEMTQDSKEDKLSTYFLVAILVIAVIAGVYWFFFDQGRTVEIVVSILIVACPCALALSKPFTYGNIMRVLGRRGLYLKNNLVIESINDTTDIVFDKTGTLTTNSTNQVRFIGDELSQNQTNQIILLANSSTHPLSISIVKNLKNSTSTTNFELVNFREIEGKGIEGNINGDIIKIGSSHFVGQTNLNKNETSSHVSINRKHIGRFVFQSEFRPGIVDLLNKLSLKYRLHILSGDKDKDKNFIEKEIPAISNLHFKQSPKDKLSYISSLQEDGCNVLMIGDGLNDAGALEVANTGIAISEDIFRFSPKSDAILKATKLYELNKLFATSNYSKTVLNICYLFSIIYNLVGLSFAVTGNLTPLIAAILMPLSSISIVLLSTLLTIKK
ncbi:MAG TPA: HAD family hydrolase [Crocinitomicaceae bacterium]|nr:HAD family hydrolase [Crocinitomicaceae bacterium]